MKRAKATQLAAASTPEPLNPARLVEADLAAAEAKLSRLLDSKEPIIAEICHYLVDAGGKRLRPTFIMLVYRACGGPEANAGVDESNSLEDERAILLPEDPDASASRLRDEIRRRLGVTVAVLITDTFGRPWRDGLTEICLGIAGMNPVLDLRGTTDLGGRELHHTVIAIADEIASAAGLLMEKAGAIPAVVVRGYKFEPFEGSAKILIRPAEADLFR